MSRIGKEPINFSANVDVSLNGNKITIKGSKGESFYITPDCIHVEVKENQIVVARGDDKKFSKAMFGTVRSLINNMIILFYLCIFIVFELFSLYFVFFFHGFGPRISAKFLQRPEHTPV